MTETVSYHYSAQLLATIAPVHRETLKLVPSFIGELFTRSLIKVSELLKLLDRVEAVAPTMPTYWFTSASDLRVRVLNWQMADSVSRRSRWKAASSLGVNGGKSVTLTAGQTSYEGLNDIHTVGHNASKTEPAKFVVSCSKTKTHPL